MTHDPQEEQRIAEILTRAEELIGLKLRDPSLLREAVTHTSYRNEHDEVTYDNQRLEFLGDSVLGCAIADLLFARFEGEPEGMLTRYRALLVSEDGLASVARELRLGEVLLLGRGEELTGGAEKPSLLADVYESIVGAIYVDQGYEAARERIATHFGSRLAQIARKNRYSDFKTKLQEIVQRRFSAIPAYRIALEEGPDHDKTFHAELLVRSKVCAMGLGKSKKDAEQNAARAVWEILVADEAAELPELPEGPAQ